MRKLAAVTVGLVLTGLALVLMMAGTSAVYAGQFGPNGVDIKIRAQNRSTDDTPHCGVGADLIGDRLDVDAFMNPTGFVTGTARFEDANGMVTIIDIDRLFAFTVGTDGGGVLVQNEISGNTVAI